MLKNKIVDVIGEEFNVGAPKAKGVVALGAQVLLELLSPEDILGPQKIHLPNAGSVVSGAPQAYIRGLGPLVKPEEWGFKVGDRVVVSGNFTPLPEAVSNNGRAMGVAEPHIIKAKILE